MLKQNLNRTSEKGARVLTSEPEDTASFEIEIEEPLKSREVVRYWRLKIMTVDEVGVRMWERRGITCTECLK